MGSGTVQPMEGKVASITEFRRPTKKRERSEIVPGHVWLL